MTVEKSASHKSALLASALVHLSEWLTEAAVRVDPSIAEEDEPDGEDTDDEPDPRPQARRRKARIAEPSWWALFRSVG